jgi:hypothetical protein
MAACRMQGPSCKLPGGMCKKRGSPPRGFRTMPSSWPPAPARRAGNHRKQLRPSVLQILGTDRLAAVGQGPMLGLGDQLADLPIQGSVEFTRNVALLDGFLRLALADDHVGHGSSNRRRVQTTNAGPHRPEGIPRCQPPKSLLKSSRHAGNARPGAFAFPKPGLRHNRLDTECCQD